MCLTKVVCERFSLPYTRYGIKLVRKLGTTRPYYSAVYALAGGFYGWSALEHKTILCESGGSYPAGVHAYLSITLVPWHEWVGFDTIKTVSAHGYELVAVSVKLTEPVCGGYELTSRHCLGVGDAPKTLAEMGDKLFGTQPGAINTANYLVPIVVYKHMQIIRELRHTPLQYFERMVKKPLPFSTLCCAEDNSWSDMLTKLKGGNKHA